MRWTRPTVVEDSRSKESRRVSKKTGSTEGVQKTTDREKRASRTGRRANEIPLDNPDHPDAPHDDPDDARDATLQLCPS